MEIGQINRGSRCGEAIFELCCRPTVQNVIEVGTWNGMGSTKCVIDAMSINSNLCFTSIESNTAWHSKAISNLRDASDVFGNRLRLVHGTLSPIDSLDTDNLINQEAQWLADDKRNIGTAPDVRGVMPAGIDVAILDGGEFSGWADYCAIKDSAKYIVIDDTKTRKNRRVRESLLSNPEFLTVFDEQGDRYGWCIFERIANSLPRIQSVTDIITGVRLAGIANIQIGGREADRANNILSLGLDLGIVCVHGNPDVIRNALASLGKSKSSHVLVTHFSDNQIDESLFSQKPQQVKKWFAENAAYNSDDLVPVPIGFENESGPSRGAFTDFAFLERIETNQSLVSIKKKKNGIYVNFSETTHPNRRDVKQKLRSNPLCSIKDSKIPFSEYMYDMAQYAYVASPRGNGMDCHRTWEALFCGCIPLVDDTLISRYFSKYSPMIIIQDWNSITPEFLESERVRIESENLTRNIESLSFWKNTITGVLKDG